MRTDADRPVLASTVNACVLAGLVTAASLSLAGCAPDTSDEPVRPDAAEIDEQTRIHLFEARRAYQDGRLRDALSLTDTLERRTDSLPVVPFLRARVLDRLKMYEAAGEAYEETARLDATYPGVRFHRGRIAHLRGRSETALRHFRRALDVVDDRAGGPSASTVFLHLGRALERLGRHEEAREAYENALDQERGYAPAHAELSVLHRRRGEVERALHHARRASTTDSSSGYYSYLEGVALLQSGRHREALVPLRVATQKRPGHQGSVQALARALYSTGDTTRADRYFARADTLQRLEGLINQARASARGTSDPDRYARLGSLLVEARRYEEAQSILSLSLELDPGHEPARRHLDGLEKRRSASTSR